MLVIEGPDNVGKTTLARSICERMNGTYSHMTRPGLDFDWNDDYRVMLEDKRFQPFPIFDRFHFGAIAYHKNSMPLERLHIINGRIHAMGGLVVLIHASNLDAYRNALTYSGKEEMFPVDDLVDAATRFNSLTHYADICIDVTVPHSNYLTYCGVAGEHRIINEWMARLAAL